MFIVIALSFLLMYDLHSKEFFFLLCPVSLPTACALPSKFLIGLFSVPTNG